MRKLFVLFAVTLAFPAMAQKAAIQTAINYIRYEDYDKAKEAIDGAAVAESTMGMAKTWYYRGQVYQFLYESKNDKFKALKPGSLLEAKRSFEKALELDTKKEFSEDVLTRLNILESQLIGDGADLFKDGKYAESRAAFEQAAGISTKLFNRVDTLALYNSALAAEKTGDKAYALKTYSQVAGMGYGGPKMYNLIAQLQLDQKDTVAAMATLNKGRAQYPEDNNLLLTMLNMYLATGKDKEAFDQMDQAITADPSNANLHFAKGSLADKLGKEDVAQTCYKKAIELKADYFEPNYNLGAMIFNSAAEMVNKANKIPLDKQAEFNAAKKKYEEKFREAIPYLEQARTINPNDRSTVQSWKEIDTRIGDAAKAVEMKKLYDSLK